MNKPRISARNIMIISFCCLGGILLLFLLHELLRAALYYGGSGAFRPETPRIHGIDHYTNESYLKYDGCTEASKYLPSADEISQAEYADFYYVNKTPVETLFGNGAIAVCVGLQYADSVYIQKKTELMRKSRTKVYLDGNYTESRLLTKVKLNDGEYLYFFAVCSDETKSIAYFVCIDNKLYSASEMIRLSYAVSLETSAFWKHFFPSKEIGDTVYAG